MDKVFGRVVVGGVVSLLNLNRSGLDIGWGGEDEVAEGK